MSCRQLLAMCNTIHTYIILKLFQVIDAFINLYSLILTTIIQKYLRKKSTMYHLFRKVYA